jgi:hypothetical protein
MEHKRGATFDLILLLDAAIPEGSFVDYVPTCQLRDFDYRLIASVQAGWVDPLTTMAIALHEADTSAWRIGTAMFDVSLRRESPLSIIPSSTLSMSIVEKVTRP